MSQKTILVTGATGLQGGSVARHLLKGGKFHIRALTRKPDSERAKALQKAGAEIIKGDLADLGSLRAALKDCYGVFGVTNFWEHFEKEYEHGHNLVQAVKGSGVKHFVFSSLPSPKSLGSDLKVPHFEMKARVEQEIKDAGISATFVHVAFYYENFLFFLPPQRKEDGTFAFGFPQGDTPLAAVSVADIGGVVAPIFDKPEQFIGKQVGVVGDDLKPSDYADIMSRALGKKVVYNYIPREIFAGFGFPGADDLANMFDMNRQYIPNRQQDLAESRRLYPKMKTLESWIVENKDKFQSILAG